MRGIVAYFAEVKA